MNNEDMFPGPSIRILIPGAATQCDSCKSVYVVKPQPEDVDLKKIERHAQSQNLHMIMHKIPPTGLDLRSQ